MTSLILYGFNNPRSIALINELRLANQSFEFVHADPELFDKIPMSKTHEAALIWCLGSSISFPVTLSNAIAAQGTPVVAVADESSVELFDFNSGHIELCFDIASSREIEARIKTVRARATIQSAPIITHGNLTIDVTSFTVSLNDRNIELTYKEYELLKLFASNPGRVFRREDILNRIWGDDYFGGTRTVDVHVRRLRSKLDDVSHSIIETMWRVGYRFSPPEIHTVSTNSVPRKSVSAA